ncbi:MAG: 30S ribosomal protein S18 [Candidatus Sericytochromatia bacterium]|nr:30S ribosomal protein S18 [Candidatus Sericytochromatia bacterium]
MAAEAKKRQRKRRRKPCPFLSGQVDKVIDYKDVMTLRRFVSEDGKILPRRVTGVSAKYQRILTVAIGRAREIALLPYQKR